MNALQHFPANQKTGIPVARKLYRDRIHYDDNYKEND